MAAGRVVLVCADERKQRVVVGAIPASYRPMVASVADLVIMLASGEAVGAVIEFECGTPSLWRHLGGMQRNGVAWPALVLFPDGELTARLGFAAAAELHATECRARAWPVLRRAIIEWRFARVACQVQAQFALDADILADAVHAALTSDPPIQSVSDLARRTGRTRSALYAAWTRVMSDDCCFSLAGFLRWIVLERALAAKSSRTSWTAAARRTGTYLHRLERIVRRLYRCSLDEFEAEGLEVLFRGEESVFPCMGVGKTA